MKIFTKLLLCAWFGWSVSISMAQAAPTAPNNDQELPSATQKSEPAPEKVVDAPTEIATDVALSGKEGVLLGQVVDPNGKALANHTVQLTTYNRVLARSKSNQKGYFAFRHLKGGVYQIASDDSIATVRAWSNGTAPKSAKPKVLLVTGRQTIRGQQAPQGKTQGGKRIRRLLKNPIVIGGIIATAVAVPLSVNSSKDSGSNGEESNTVTAVPEIPDAVGGTPASQ